MKRLSPPGLNAADVTAFAVAPDGQSDFGCCELKHADTRIVSYPASGAGTERPLFTVTGTVWYLDASTGWKRLYQHDGPPLGSCAIPA